MGDLGAWDGAPPRGLPEVVPGLGIGAVDEAPLHTSCHQGAVGVLDDAFGFFPGGDGILPHKRSSHITTSAALLDFPSSD